MNDQLIQQCKNGELDDIKKLISQGADINYINKDGLDCIYASIQNTNLQICQYLLDLGIEIQDDEISFEIIDTYPDDDELFKIFLQKGMNVNISDEYGTTPLMFAASCGNIEVCKLCIQHMVDINAQDNEGNTMLHHAIEYSSGPRENPYLEEIVSFFIENKGDINIVNNKGLCATSLLTIAMDNVIEYDDPILDSQILIRAFKIILLKSNQKLVRNQKKNQIIRLILSTDLESKLSNKQSIKSIQKYLD